MARSILSLAARLTDWPRSGCHQRVSILAPVAFIYGGLSAPCGVRVAFDFAFNVLVQADRFEARGISVKESSTKNIADC